LCGTFAQSNRNPGVRSKEKNGCKIRTEKAEARLRIPVWLGGQARRRTQSGRGRVGRLSVGAKGSGAKGVGKMGRKNDTMTLWSRGPEMHRRKVGKNAGPEQLVERGWGIAIK